jgi:DNA-binding NarL/FixJ family response regulator
MGALDTPKKRVVVVDDEDTVRAALSAVVNSMHCEVVGEGRDAQEAIDLYRQHQPDLLMLDVNMPGGDGRDALRDIRREFPSARVVVLTADGDSDTVTGCVALGATRYVLKSTSVARLRVMLGEVLGLGN